MLPKALFFGELLMRLAPRGHERFLQATEFDVGYTGAEANAAVALALFGLESHVISAVPDHELGQACVNHFRRYGVRTDHVLRMGQRLGIFYLEAGASQRPSNVIYDRSGTSFSELRPGQFDWEQVLAGAGWFHWSGTAPALGEQLPALLSEACEAARRHAVTVSCDLNFRSKLWSTERARATLLPLMRDVDVLIGNEEHIGLLLGVTAETSGPGSEAGGQRDPVHWRCESIVRRLHAQFRFRHVAITARETLRVNEYGWRAFLSDGSALHGSRSYGIVPVDAVGAGDAFSAGLIYGLMTGASSAEAVELAAAAGCLKHSIPGDLNLATLAEVRAVMQGQTGLRIQR